VAGLPPTSPEAFDDREKVMRAGRFRDERGQVVPLVAVVVVLVGVLCLALGRLGGSAATVTRAHTAADAAALAGAAGGEGAARSLAVANGGRVVTYREVDGEVEVVVAVADARRDGGAPPGRPLR
jgi:hypothetical protein